jgi:hypothetical protein
MTGNEIVRKKSLQETGHEKAKKHEGRRFQQHIPRSKKNGYERIDNNIHDSNSYFLRILI